MTHGSDAGAFRAGVLAGDRSAARTFLASGADPDAAGPDGRTPLMFAVAVGADGVAAELVSGGAGVNAAGSRGMTALHEAAAGGRDVAAGALLDAGAAADAAGGGGVTPLMCAAAWGHVAVAERLLRRGADPRRRDDRGGTARDAAGEKGHDEAARLLSAAEAAGPGTRYWFTTCRRCDRQGRLFLMEDLSAGRLYLHCEECEYGWLNPSEVDDVAAGFLTLDQDFGAEPAA